MKDKFDIGDLVEVINTSGAWSGLLWATGVVRGYRHLNDMPVAVEFDPNSFASPQDANRELHDCSGLTERYCGQWFKESQLSAVEVPCEDVDYLSTAGII